MRQVEQALLIRHEIVHRLPDVTVYKGDTRSASTFGEVREMADLCRHGGKRTGGPAAAGDHDMQTLPRPGNGQKRSVHEELFGQIVAGVDDFDAQAGIALLRKIAEHVQAGPHLQGDVARDGSTLPAADLLEQVQGSDVQRIMRILTVFTDQIDAAGPGRPGAEQVFPVVPLAAVPGDPAAEGGIVERRLHPVAQGLHVR